MKIKVATIFPEMFEILDVGIIGRAKQNGLIDIQIYNIRDYSADKHKKDRRRSVRRRRRYGNDSATHSRRYFRYG